MYPSGEGIDGCFYEFESYTSPFKKDKIGRMLSQGIKQSSRIIINTIKDVQIGLSNEI